MVRAAERLKAEDLVKAVEKADRRKVAKDERA